MGASRKIGEYIFLAILLQSHHQVFGQEELTAQLSAVRLPSGRMTAAIAYDGADTIYLFGGKTSLGISSQILRYSISQDDIEIVNVTLPQPSEGGCASFGRVGEVFYFGGYFQNSIYRLSTSNNSLQEVGRLPEGYWRASAMKVANSSTIYIIGGGGTSGFGNDVVTFDTETHLALKAGQLPRGNEQFLYSIAAVWSDEDQSAVLFADVPTAVVAMTYTPSSGDYVWSEDRLPYHYGTSAAVWNGENAYLIGGTGLPSSYPVNGLKRYNKVSNSVDFVPVRGFPGSTANPFWGTAAVFVPSVKRIYMFGGQTGTNPSFTYRNEIWFVDLD